LLHFLWKVHADPRNKADAKVKPTGGHAAIAGRAAKALEHTTIRALYCVEHNVRSDPDLQRHPVVRANNKRACLRSPVKPLLGWRLLGWRVPFCYDVGPLKL
jgi:hypothetical protein